MGGVSRARVLGLGLVALAVSMASWPAMGAEWVLMGRHGGCTSLAELTARKPVLEGVSSPSELIAKLRRQGVAVSTKQNVLAGSVTMVEVTAPERGLYLIFVPAEICDKLK